MIREFTDTDYAVILDCLTIVRDQLKGDNLPTPNVEAVIEKMGSWAKPTGCGFTALTGDDAAAMRLALREESR